MDTEGDLAWVSLGPHISYDAKVDWSSQPGLSFLSPGWASITEALSTHVAVLISGSSMFFWA